MTDWHGFIINSLVVAHSQYLIVDSSLSKKLQSKLKLPQFLQELIRCPVCTGFWLALGLSALQYSSVLGVILGTISTAMLGDTLYQLKQKFLPCEKCKGSFSSLNWKVN